MMTNQDGDGETNHWKGMEAARERSSAPGTPSSTGGREGGGDISKLGGQSKNQKKNFIEVMVKMTTKMICADFCLGIQTPT